MAGLERPFLCHLRKCILRKMTSSLERISAGWADPQRCAPVEEGLLLSSQVDLMQGFLYTVEVTADRKMPAVKHHKTTLTVHNAFIKYNTHYTLEHTCWHFLKTAACSCMWVPHLFACVFVSRLLHDSYKGREALNFLVFVVWNPNVKFHVFITALIFRVVCFILKSLLPCVSSLCFPLLR